MLYRAFGDINCPECGRRVSAMEGVMMIATLSLRFSVI